MTGRLNLMAEHSRLSASGSHIWLNCQGSVKLSEGIKDESSHAAREGTVAHKLGEDAIKAHFLNENLDLSVISGTYIDDVYVDLEMVAAVKILVDVVHESYQDGDELFLEERVSLTYLHKDMFGTSDIIIKHQDTSITIIDFKYGKWPVDPTENSQLIYYFLGARNEARCIRGNLKVVQPRSRDGVVVKSWTLEQDQFERWEKKFAEAARMADIGTPIVKGSWCRFCRAKSLCPVVSPGASPLKEKS